MALAAGVVLLIPAPTAQAAPVGVPPGGGQSSVAPVAWGNNDRGQTDVPTGLVDVVAISAGPTHALALKADGTVVAWGNSFSGEADVPAGLDDVVAVAAGGTFSLALKSDGTVVGWGDGGAGATSPPAGLSGVVAIAATSAAGMALTSGGTVVVWGNSNYGQMDVPAGLDQVVAIAGGANYNMAALRADGTVVTWGALTPAPPAGLTDVVAIAAGQVDMMALKSDGTVVTWGMNWMGEANVPAGLSDVVAIAMGATAYALQADGTLVSWGQFPLADPPDNLFAVAGGASFTVGLVGSAPVLTADTPPTIAALGSAVDYTFAATAAPLPRFAVTSGSLPPGLTLDPVTGQLSGTATEAGSYTFQVSATNGFAPDAVGAVHTITVPGAPGTPAADGVDTPAPLAAEAPQLAATGYAATVPLTVVGFGMLLGGAAAMVLVRRRARI